MQIADGLSAVAGLPMALSAGGSGDCGAAAMGAATSVVLNNLLKAATDGTTTATDKDGKPLGQEEQAARSNLVATLVGAIASVSGLDVNAAITAAQIEGQNNSQKMPDGGTRDVTSPQARFTMEL